MKVAVTDRVHILLHFNFEVLCDYEDGYLQASGVTCSGRILPMFQYKFLPPSSWYKRQL
jgi:hypothetical protein